MKKFRKGFTFVELLIVVSIFSLLSLAVFATFSSGMRMWQLMQARSLVERRVLLGLERFSAEIRQTLDFSKIGFEGKISKIIFPLLSAENEILRVSYVLEQDTLYRKQERYKDILEDNKQIKTRDLFSDIESLKFSFAYKVEDKDEYNWINTWDKEAGFPAIVKIELKTKDVDFTKMVVMP